YRVSHTALHLRGLVKPWFMQWLQQSHPELVAKYIAMYPGNRAYAPSEYRKWLAAKIRPLIIEAGLAPPKTSQSIRGSRRATPLDPPMQPELEHFEPGPELILPTLF